LNGSVCGDAPRKRLLPKNVVVDAVNFELNVVNGVAGKALICGVNR